MRRADVSPHAFSRDFRQVMLLLLACVSASQACIAVSNQPGSTSKPTPASSAAPAAVALAKEAWLVESFESEQGTSGGFWCAFDSNGLGTQVSPTPFVLAKDGAPP